MDKNDSARGTCGSCDSAAAQLVWTTSVDDAIAAVERGWAEAGSVGVAEPTPAEFLEAEP